MTPAPTTRAASAAGSTSASPSTPPGRRGCGPTWRPGRLLRGCWYESRTRTPTAQRPRRGGRTSTTGLAGRARAALGVRPRPCASAPRRSQPRLQLGWEPAPTATGVGPDLLALPPQAAPCSLTARAVAVC
jgi:hypothetical protein